MGNEPIQAQHFVAAKGGVPFRIQRSTHAEREIPARGVFPYCLVSEGFAKAVDTSQAIDKPC